MHSHTACESEFAGLSRRKRDNHSLTEGQGPTDAIIGKHYFGRTSVICSANKRDPGANTFAQDETRRLVAVLGYLDPRRL